MNTIKDTLEYIVKAIVPETESKDIVITDSEENSLITFEISAPSEVVGKIIGKEGKIIKSIRTILNLSYPTTRFLLKIKD
ncbi:MAG: KH domain-containing protein [Candidatus Shapirobacteria bacterium]|nr:KH domain-containing protein [Candidatus Shapirobacteria bacterium]MDD4410393.1 KH domain-containing protein [Candidatus Shapirobacteria bacterium]